MESNFFHFSVPMKDNPFLIREPQHATPSETKAAELHDFRDALRQRYDASKAKLAETPKELPRDFREELQAYADRKVKQAEAPAPPKGMFQKMLPSLIAGGVGGLGGAATGFFGTGQGDLETRATFNRRRRFNALMGLLGGGAAGAGGGMLASALLARRNAAPAE